MKTKCENCGSGDFTRFVGINLNCCNACGSWWLDGRSVAVPEYSQWNTFEKNPPKISSIVIKDNERMWIENIYELNPASYSAAINNYKEKKYLWKKILLPKHEEKER